MSLLIAIMTLATFPLAWRFLAAWFQQLGLGKLASHGAAVGLALVVFVLYMLTFFPPEGEGIGWGRFIGAVLVFSVISYAGVDPRHALDRLRRHHDESGP